MSATARQRPAIRRAEVKTQVVKRDGRKVPFDAGKIENAVAKCFMNALRTQRGDALGIGNGIAATVANILSRRGDAEVGVEEVQQLVIQQLWAAEHFQAAEHYTLYREQRRLARTERPIDPDLERMINEDARHFAHPIQYYQFLGKFSRWKPEEKRRETWREACTRVMDFFKRQEKLAGKLTDDEWALLDRYLYEQKATCAMRVIQMAGPALDRCHVGVYNCSYLPILDWFSFAELLYILMQGTGAGFSVECDYVEQLPRIRRQRKGVAKHKFQIEDSTEGWCDAFFFGLQKWAAGEDVEYDYSLIRPAGTPLKTKGGRASGPEPFKQLLEFARNLILSRQGGHLTDLDCHDLACMTGKIVQVGGVRRASLISLSGLDSHDMRNAKSGAWYQNHLHRMMANNSAVYDDEPDDITFMDEWLALAKSGSGERGIFNRDGVMKMLPKRRKKHRFGCNPCAEIILRPWQFCNLTIAVSRHDDTPETLREKVRVAAIFGTLQAALTNFNYIREEWRKNCEEEALLGVDVTGQMDCPILRPGAPGREELLEDFKRITAETNEKWAAKLGINRSASDTCVKPSGDSSAFFWCGSGIHAWFADFFIRRTRERGDSPVAKMLKDAGVPWIQAPEDASLICFEWPSRPAGAGAPTRKDFTAVEQLENWLVWKKHFAEHSVSCTIYVEPHEWLEVGVWVKKHFGEISGLSFLPRDNGVYTGTPYEEIDEAEYKRRVDTFPSINWAKLMRYEQEDMTEGSQTYACSGGTCELI